MTIATPTSIQPKLISLLSDNFRGYVKPNNAHTYNLDTLKITLRGRNIHSHQTDERSPTDAQGRYERQPLHTATSNRSCPQRPTRSAQANGNTACDKTLGKYMSMTALTPDQSTSRHNTVRVEGTLQPLVHSQNWLLSSPSFCSTVSLHSSSGIDPVETRTSTPTNAR